MKPDEIFAEIDKRLEAELPEIELKQAEFLRGNGRLFQGLLSHSLSAIPADGAEAAPDKTGAKPGYQAASWNDMGGLPAAMMSARRIDQYERPEGAGYVVTDYVRIAGELWARSVNVGPAEELEMPWSVMN